MQSQKPELLLANNDESKAHFDSNYIYTHKKKLQK